MSIRMKYFKQKSVKKQQKLESKYIIVANKNINKEKEEESKIKRYRK